MTAASVPAAPSMFAVFRKRDFSLLWLAQLISTAGSALTDLAAAIFVFRVTGSALAVGLTLMVTAVPSLVVGLLAGVFVDRHDRKRILIVTCLIQAVIVGLIAVVIGIDALAIPGLYGLLLLNAAVKQFFRKAYEDNLTGLSAMVAYNLLLSLLPVTLLALVSALAAIALTAPGSEGSYAELTVRTTPLARARSRSSSMKPRTFGYPAKYASMNACAASLVTPMSLASVNAVFP